MPLVGLFVSSPKLNKVVIAQGSGVMLSNDHNNAFHSTFNSQKQPKLLVVVRAFKQLDVYSYVSSA